MWILSCVQLTNTYSKLTNSFLVTVVDLSTAKMTNSENPICFWYLMSCSVNRVLHDIHMQKFYVFRFFVEKCLLHEIVGKEGGTKVAMPLPFSLALYYKHIINICFSSQFALRIPSVLSSFLHAIWSALSSLFPRHFFCSFKTKTYLNHWNSETIW